MAWAAASLKHSLRFPISKAAQTAQAVTTQPNLFILAFIALSRSFTLLKQIAALAKGNTRRTEIIAAST